MAALDRMAAVARGAARNLYRPSEGGAPAPQRQEDPTDPDAEIRGGTDGTPPAPGGTWVAPDGTTYFENPSGDWVKAGPPIPSVSVTTGYQAPANLNDPNADLGALQRQAMSDQSRVPLTDPRAGEAFGVDPALWENVNALVEQGLMTGTQAQKVLFGDTTGGSGVGYAQLAQRQAEFEYEKEQDVIAQAYREKQDALTNILNELSAIRQQQVLATTARDNARSALISAAPNLNDGRQYFGGYEPGGPAQALADFSGYQFNAQPLRTVPISFDPNPAPGDPAAMAILNRLMGGQ